MVQSCLVKLFHLALRVMRLALVIACAVLLLTGSSLPPGKQLEKVRAFTRQIEFDFIGWTFDALKLKFFEASLGTNRYLSEAQRRQVVLEYLGVISQIQHKEDDLKQIYADPAVSDPRLQSTALRFELDTLYERRDQLDTLAEEILQSQISQIVSEGGAEPGGSGCAACFVPQHTAPADPDHQPSRGHSTR